MNDVLMQKVLEIMELKRFNPTPKQMEFITANQDEVLFGGAAGGGKSYGQLIDAWIKAFTYPGIKQLLLRRTFPELKRSLIMTSLDIFDQGQAKYNESDKKWKFTNGSLIEFGYCDSENDVTQYQSAEYDIIRFDELTHFSEFQYTYLISRIRGVNKFPKQIKSSTNPGGIGHAWVKKRFIDDQIPGREFYGDHDIRLIFIPSLVTENTYLMESDPRYIQRLEQLPENQRKALLYGEWEIFEGQYFPEFLKDKHVVQPFSIPEHWKRFVSIDWGYNDPCAIYWHAVDQEKRVYTYRELYITQTLASDVSKKIQELSGDENIAYVVGSPDMWQKRGNSDGISGESIAETFSKNGLNVIRADNDRLNGWQRMHEYLADAPDGTPYWQIFNICTQLIRTLPALVHDEKRVEDVSDKCEDHAPESCRYALMSRPRPNKQGEVEITGTYFRDELRMKGYKDYQIDKLRKKGKIKLIGEDM
jgi:phage terminase large subunit